MAQTDMNTQAKVYELGYHLVPTLNDKDLSAEITGISKILGDLDASVVSEATPELIELAYTISRQESEGRADYDSAYFGWTKFSLTAEQISKLDETLDANSNVLRFIIVKTSEEEYAPFESTEETESDEADEEEEKESPKKTTKKAAAKLEKGESDLDDKINDLVVE